MTNILKYGQWDVEFSELKENEWRGEIEYYITCEVVGNWNADKGIWSRCEQFGNRMCYDTPELLPKGLRKRINKKAEKYLAYLISQKEK